jgi:ribosomal-protein-alanine N-acetyltransferase
VSGHREPRRGRDTFREAGDPRIRIRHGTVEMVNLATAGARARIGTWPHEPDIGHLVLTDHEMIPGHDDVAHWIASARERGFHRVRTGALFPASTAAFASAGFLEIDSLLLLQLDLADRPLPSRAAPPSRPALASRHAGGFVGRGPTRRLTAARLAEAAAVDELAFGRRWSNDTASLDAIREATPSHRSRMVVDGGSLRGFAVSGRAGTRGYVQRLAVDPAARRRGIGRTLVADALGWMDRHDVGTVLVNTAADNEAALALYESFGFRPQQGELKVLELSLGS